MEEASQNVLGVKKKTKHPNWVSNNTQELEQQCIQAKKKYQNKRSAASHHQWRSLEDALRKSFSDDEKRHLDTQIREMEIAAKRNQLGRTWELINKLSGKSETKVTKIRLLDG